MRSRPGLVALVLLVLSAAPANASDDFEAALKSACAEASALTDARLLDMARATYLSLDRAAPGYFCESETVDARLHAVQSAQRRRAHAIEVARVLRLAAKQRAAQATERTLELWRERAYERYVAGLTIDPVADGARAGLRRLLKDDPGGDHCDRAHELLRARLLWEARAEIARGMTSTSAAACRSARKALVKRRARAFEHVHRGLAAERAGHTASARAQFIAALAADPGAHGARAGLRRVPAPLPTKAAQPSLLTRLEIGGDCARGKTSGPRPALVSLVTIRVAAGDPDVRLMREDRARGTDFRAARDSLLDRVGLPRPDDERLTFYGYNAQDRAGSVELTTADGVATVTLRVDGAIHERRPQHAWPWTITPDHEGVTIQPGVRPAPPGMRRRAELASCGWQAVDTSLQPGSDSAPTNGERSTLAWDLETRGVNPPPTVTLSAPRLDRLSLGGSSAWAAVRSIGALLVPGGLFAIALLLLRKAKARRLRLAAVVGLLTVLAHRVVVYVLFESELDGTVVRVAFAVLPLALVLLLFLTLAAPSSAVWRALWGVASAAALGFVAWSAADWAWFEPSGDVVLALAVGLVALMSYALLATAASGLALGVGRPRSDWKKIWRRTANAVIWVTVLAQAGQAALQWRTDWPNRAVVFEGDDPLREAWKETLGFDVMYVPLDVLGASMLLLVVPAAGLAVAALELRRQPRRATFASRRLRWLVGLLFAVVALGTSAPLLGLPVPVAFVVSLIYLRWTRSKAVDRAETFAREQLNRSEKEHSVLSEKRRELLERAGAVRRQQRVEDDLHSKYAAGDGELEESKLADGLRKAQDRTRKLRRGDPLDPPEVTVPLPDGSPPEVIALALGPTGDWRANGREGVRLALPLIAIPVAFSAYVIAEGIVDRWSLARPYHPPLAVMGSLAAESLFWIVSAFTLGALLAYLPFRSAPAKGVALAGAYIVPLLMLHLISDLVDELTHFGRLFHLQLSSWSFRGFELLLFLVAVGVRLDRESVKNTVARLVPLYGLDDFRATIVYAAPVVLTIVLVGGQLFRGEASGAIQTILENATNFVPAGAGFPGLGR